MNAGATGGAMIFFSLLAMEVIASLFVLSYTAHSLLVVIEHTSAGNDEVEWPNEPFVDWLWKFWYLAWLVAMAVVPTTLLLKLFTLTTVQFYGLLVVVPWLLLPVQLLSSLGASTRWVVFHPVIFGKMLRRLDALVVLYVVSGLLGAGSLALTILALGSSMLLLPVAAAALSAMVLIYGRLLGRLAWMINQGRPVAEAPRPRTPSPLVAPVSWDDHPPRKGRNPAQPSAAALWDEEPPPVRKKKSGPSRKTRPSGPIPTGEETHPVKPDRYFTKDTYKMKDYEPPPAEAPAERTDATGYDVLPPARKPAREKRPEAEPALAEVSRYELELAGLRAEAPPPAWPLFTGVYSFPWYPASLVPFTWLTGGYCLMGFLLTMMLQYMPG